MDRVVCPGSPSGSAAASATDHCRAASLVAPRRPGLFAKTGPLGLFKQTLIIGGLGVPLVASGAAAEVDVSKLPPRAEREVSFSTDIQPIFDKTCLRCHGREKPKSGFRLDNRESALKGGENGVDIIPGDSARSPLIHYVARLVEEMEMPPTGKGEPLSAAEVGLLRSWIDQGARWSEAPAGPLLAFSVTPAVQFITVSGNAARFREHYGTRESWGGGATDFSLKYDVDPKTHVTLEGRAMAGQGDYRVRTRVERDELGWVRLDYTEFSRYYDDTGGYYPQIAPTAPRLGEDLVVRNRHATLELGLNLPEWPTIRVAYDLYLRDGNESTLNWGSVSQGDLARNIYPGVKSLDETTHLITLDINYNWKGLAISDQAQFEWHQQRNQRTNYEFNTPDFSFSTLGTDEQDYWRGANVIRIERSLRDWLYLSGGYLYSQLKDLGGFRVESFSPTDPTTPPTLTYNTDSLTVRRHSHVINGNAMLGPWNQLYFYAGLQAEWTHQEGFATGQDPFSQNRSYNANLDRTATDESFGLRYSGIPHTVLFAETHFQQESYSQYEQGLDGDQQDFLRDTDATGDLKDFQAGFVVSPWRMASFHAKYRHRDRANDYDNLENEQLTGTPIDFLSSTNGYPAFIRQRDTRTDEVELRLVLQPLRWLKTTLTYGHASTDFTTETDSGEASVNGAAETVPGGTLIAGQYDAHTVGAGLVLTPWSRLHLATTLAWTTSRSLSGVNNDREVVPYEGNIWNLLNSATYILDEKTDLLATYLFSRADFTQHNADYALPLGMAYTRHAATAGLTRRMKHGRTVRLEYGFFTYDEPTLGGAANYTAHALFASYRIPWP